MTHKVVQEFYNMQSGTKIVVLDNTGTAVKVHFLRWSLNTILVQFPGGSHQVLPAKNYQYTYTCSKDCADFIKRCRTDNLVGLVTPNVVEMITTIWAACEAHYGIGGDGSETKDRKRELALAILKGDPIALDAARDILGIQEDS